MTVALIPAMSAAGFVFVALSPGFGTVVAFSLLRPAGNFAIARPAREILFAKLDREDKYRAKSFIDAAVYRAGDQRGAWAYAGFESVGGSGAVWRSLRRCFPCSGWSTFCSSAGAKSHERGGSGVVPLDE